MVTLPIGICTSHNQVINAILVISLGFELGFCDRIWPVVGALVCRDRAATVPVDVVIFDVTATSHDLQLFSFSILVAIKHTDSWCRIELKPSLLTRLVLQTQACLIVTKHFHDMSASMDQNQSIKSELTLENQQNNTHSLSESTPANISPPLSRPQSLVSAGSFKSAPSKEPGDYSEGESLENEHPDKTLSRRRSYASGHESAEWEQIERLISRMFGKERKANSEEEKTRHVGVIWKNLTVKGVGLGAALQPTNGEILLAIPRLIKRLFTRGRKDRAAGKPEMRTILDDFTVRNVLEY